MFAPIAFCTMILGVFIAIPLLAINKKRPANLWLGLFVLGMLRTAEQSSAWRSWASRSSRFNCSRI